jgi:hypothetical protein
VGISVRRGSAPVWHDSLGATDRWAVWAIRNNLAGSEKVLKFISKEISKEEVKQRRKKSKL